MKNEVTGGVSECEVVDLQLGILGVESELVAGEPSLVSDDSGGVDQRSSEVNVDITVQADAFV